MSFIQSFNYIKSKINLNSQLSERDYIKVEKLLRAYYNTHSEFSGSSVNLFIQALKTNYIGIEFLLNNPNLIPIMNGDIHWEKQKEIIYKEENISQIQSFFITYLKDDLETSITFFVAKEKYGFLTSLLEYKSFISDEIMFLIVEKINIKVSYYYDTLDKDMYESKALEPSFKKLIEILDHTNLSKNYTKITRLLKEIELEIMSRSGCSSSFYMFDRSLFWAGKEPKTTKEKIEKKMVKADVKFTSIILGCILTFVIILVSVVNHYGKEEKRAKQNKIEEVYNYSLNHFLTSNLDVNKTRITPLDNLVSQNIYTRLFPTDSTKNTPYKIYNQSTYDLIVIPDTELFELAKCPAYYVKSQDTLSVNLLFNRVYIGKNPSSTRTFSQYSQRYEKQNIFRFANPLKESKDIIQNLFEFKGDLTLKEENDQLILSSDTYFFRNGIRMKKIIFHKK